MSRSGISPRMVTYPVSTFSNGTIHAERQASDEGSSSARESESSLEPTQRTLFSFGDTSATGTTIKKASTVQSSETRVRTDRLSLSDRLTQSLITAGLVKGITPSLIRETSGAAIRDFASLPLDGGAAVHPKKGFSFSRDEQGETDA
jgi:hypothetical protein